MACPVFLAIRTPRLILLFCACMPAYRTEINIIAHQFQPSQWDLKHVCCQGCSSLQVFLQAQNSGPPHLGIAEPGNTNFLNVFVFLFSFCSHTLSTSLVPAFKSHCHLSSQYVSANPASYRSPFGFLIGRPHHTHEYVTP